MRVAGFPAFPVVAVVAGAVMLRCKKRQENRDGRGEQEARKKHDNRGFESTCA